MGHFNVSLIVLAKSQDSVHIPQFLKRKESRSGSNRGPSADQPSALPPGHTGSPPRQAYRTAMYTLGVALGWWWWWWLGRLTAAIDHKYMCVTIITLRIHTVERGGWWVGTISIRGGGGRGVGGGRKGGATQSYRKRASHTTTPSDYYWKVSGWKGVAGNITKTVTYHRNYYLF